LLALSFSFSQCLGLCGVFFTLLPVIKLIKDHWHGSRQELPPPGPLTVLSLIF
jgi:hypothetical protein